MRKWIPFAATRSRPKRQCEDILGGAAQVEDGDVAAVERHGDVEVVIDLDRRVVVAVVEASEEIVCPHGQLADEASP